MKAFDGYKYKRVVKKGKLSALFVGIIPGEEDFIKKYDLIDGPKKIGKDIDLVVADEMLEPDIDAYKNIHILEHSPSAYEPSEFFCDAAEEALPGGGFKTMHLHNCAMIRLMIPGVYSKMDGEERPIEEIAERLESPMYTFLLIQCMEGWDHHMCTYENLDGAITNYFGKRDDGGKNDFVMALAEESIRYLELPSKIRNQEFSLEEIVENTRRFAPSKFLSKELNESLSKFEDVVEKNTREVREKDWLEQFEKINGDKRILFYIDVEHTKTFTDKLINEGWKEAKLEEW